VREQSLVSSGIDTAAIHLAVFAQCAAAAPGSNAKGWLFGNGLAAKIP
jgi:hypothetical protein